jgi:hypothetical protein
MAPFFSGMAIGLAILIPIVILMFAFRILYLVGAFVYGFVIAAHASWVKAHPKQPHAAPH